MSTQRFTPEFKQEAVRQVVDRGYSVAEVSARLGVSSHSLYKWVKVVTPDKTEKQAAELIEAKSEVLKLRAQLRRTDDPFEGESESPRFPLASAEASAQAVCLCPRCRPTSDLGVDIHERPSVEG